MTCPAIALCRRIAAAIAVVLVAWSAPADEPVRIPAHALDADRVERGELTGLLWRPDGDAPHPAIVMMHGCGGMTTARGALTGRHRDWAERFRANGYVVLHVDSFRPRGLRSICETRGRDIQPGRERARDAYAALAFLQARPDVRADKVALLGWSNGGSTVLRTIDLAAATRPRDLAHDFAAAVAFYPGCRALAERRQGWTTTIPLLVLVGAADDWTPAPPCEALIARARSFGAPVELVVYPDAHHDFDAPDVALRVRTRIATTASGTATVGTHPASRADSLRRVPDFLAARLGIR